MNLSAIDSGVESDDTTVDVMDFLVVMLDLDAMVVAVVAMDTLRSIWLL